MLLDIVEVAQSHMGVVLGETFVEVLKAFGIEKKVQFSSIQTKPSSLTQTPGPKHHSRQCIQ
jgi:hypothetical protein